MNSTKRILTTFFVFLLPLAMLINYGTCFYWTADFYISGNVSTKAYLSGFPFPDNGTFGPGNSLDCGNNWTNFILNQAIIMSVAFAIYFFILRKIKFESKRSIVILTVFVVVIYLRCGVPLALEQYFHITEDVQQWPDKLDIKSIHYINTWKYFLFR